MKKDATQVAARVVGECAVSLWGLSQFERLRRQLAAAGVADVAAADQGPPPRGTVVLLRADWLFEQRTIDDLVAASAVMVERDGAAVAAHVPCGAYADALARLRGARPDVPPGIVVRTVEELSPAFNEQLRKAEPARLLPVRAAHRAALERYLFDGSYKGVTDIVTKWLWPAPARGVVRLCARLGVSPNAVTFSSVALVVAATWLFWQGYYWPGLVLGWLMTFFDTVDGKLARVTVQSTTIGHFLDKITDLVHPPIWYIAWGYGLEAHGGPPGAAFANLYAAILAGYVAGRLIEAAFKLLLGNFAIYTWRPVDAWVRLVIARRNPNLVLLTVALAAGRPDVGLYAVAAWTVVSTVYLAVLLSQGAFLRLTRGPLQSWLQSVSDDDDRFSVRVFARRRLPEELRSL